MLVPDADVKTEAEDSAKLVIRLPELWSHADVAYIDTRDLIGCFLELHGDREFEFYLVRC